MNVLFVPAEGPVFAIYTVPCGYLMYSQNLPLEERNYAMTNPLTLSVQLQGSSSVRSGDLSLTT